MPSSYKSIGGKLCTRYSELINCTSSGVDRVLQERFALKRKLELEAYDFGNTRHGMLEEHAKAKHCVPEYFGVGSIAISHAEESFAVEAFPGVVIHFTPDLIATSQNIIGDYKMWRQPLDHDKPLPTAWSLYKDSIQLDFYAWLLTFAGINIRHKLYMVEFWNNERTKILGHDFIKRPVTLADKGKARSWGIPRIKRLMAGVKVYQDMGYQEAITNE